MESLLYKSKDEVYNAMSKRELKLRIRYQKKELKMTPQKRLDWYNYVNFCLGHPPFNENDYEEVHNDDLEHLEYLQRILETKIVPKDK